MQGLSRQLYKVNPERSRQYFFFGLSILISVLAVYSFVKTYKSQSRFTFEVLPLAINSITSVIMIGIYSQMQAHNNRLVLFVVQFYSYFILCYGFMTMVMKQTDRFTQVLSRVKCIFIIITIICVVAVAALIVLGSFDKLQCNQDQGVGAIIMMALQLPLIALTYYFSHKCKHLLLKQSTIQRKEQHNPSIVTKHFMVQEDLYIKLKKLQLNLVRLALFITFLLHITEILCYYIGDSQRICQGNSLIIRNSLQLFILCVQNVTQLFPHIVIPLIFWYIPYKINARSKTIFISQQKVDNSQLNQDHHRRHQEPKLKMENGDHQESQFYKDMHSQQSIRQKLIPKTKTQRTSTL